MKLSGKIALVTGAGVRLGQAIAIYLSQQGVKVALHYHRSKTGVEATLAQMQGEGHQLFQANLTEYPSVVALAQSVQKKMGFVSILINNAADFLPTPIPTASEEQWDHLFSLNLKAPFFLTQALSSEMLQHKEGKIINLTDVAGDNPWKEFIPYCSTKAGLVSMTKGFAKALAPHVHVNGISPGTVLPPAGSEEKTNVFVKNSLLQRMGSPADIVQAVDYLLHADFVTGSILAVDGGRYLYSGENE